MKHFNPRSPCGERRAILYPFRGAAQFQSTLSLRRATGSRGKPQNNRGDFNPRSPCGERLIGEGDFQEGEEFQSTLSLRRATASQMFVVYDGRISIHALLAESDVIPAAYAAQTSISIHALLAESDGSVRETTISWRDFNPRSPCGERPMSGSLSLPCRIFQSTLSLRRATETSP